MAGDKWHGWQLQHGKQKGRTEAVWQAMGRLALAVEGRHVAHMPNGALEGSVLIRRQAEGLHGPLRVSSPLEAGIYKIINKQSWA